MDIDPEEWQSHRRYLQAVAYRLLGSVADAEDAVGAAYLRRRRAQVAEVADVRAWLRTVVSRICLDQLRAARARRESYVGTWLPEPLVGADAQPDPGDRIALVESVQTAMLIVLESLSPAERTAFVLHDVFGMSFDEIGEVVGRSAAACRQLASRAQARARPLATVRRGPRKARARGLGVPGRRRSRRPGRAGAPARSAGRLPRRRGRSGACGRCTARSRWPGCCSGWPRATATRPCM